MKSAMLIAVLVAGAGYAQGKPADKAAPAKDDKAAAPAAAPAAAAPAGMDMTKVGPWTRKPTNEAAVKKEIQDFFKKDAELMAKGDFNAMVEQVSFPVYMLTDDAKGAIESKEYSKEQYVEMMKPFYEGMPKDAKLTHKPNITVLSDNLAVVVDDFTMTIGKQKHSGKNTSLMAKVDGAWKMRGGIEAGWGGMGPPPKAEAKDSKPAASPTPANAPAKK